VDDRRQQDQRLGAQHRHGERQLLEHFAGIFTVTNTTGTTTNYLDIGAATNVPAFYYRVRLVP